MNPELRKKWTKFRRDRRGWRSLLLLAGLFAASLPAELICNSRPLAIHFSGRWYFPALHRYLESDFGGSRAVEPDYREPAFLRRLGHSAPALTPVTAVAGSATLPLFDPEPGDVAAPPAVPVAVQAPTNDARAFILWAPVRYGYATIATRSQSGRDALAAPFRQKVPGASTLLPSSWGDGHYLGTDDRGRDVLARLLFGFRISLFFGLALALTATGVGILLGGIQGFFGGWTDLLGQRFSEIWGSLPRLYLLMILSSLVARNIWVLFVILNLTFWLGISQYVRAEFLRARNFEYVRAARALGVSNWVIMRRHLLPNSLTPVITLFPFMVTGGVLALVSLDFLDLGVPSPYPSLGELLSQGQANLQATWIIIPTFLVLSGTITLLTFIGDGVRNAFDPRRA